MKKVLLSAVLGGLAIFAWGAISHVVLPWHLMTVSAFREERPVVNALAEQARGKGVYVVPAPPDLMGDTRASAKEEHAERMKQGPAAFVFFSPEGYDMKSPKPYAVGLLLCMALAAVLAGLLALAADSLPRYGSRVAFVAAAGVALALRGPLVDWNWMAHPLAYCLVNAVDILIEAFLAGLVLAAIVKPGSR